MTFGCAQEWKRGGVKYNMRCSFTLDEMKEAPLLGDLVTHTLLYQQAQAQREEILKHKWCESEKVGHDIGFERAQADWAVKHRSLWLKSWLQQTCRRV